MEAAKIKAPALITSDKVMFIISPSDTKYNKFDCATKKYDDTNGASDLRSRSNVRSMDWRL